VESGKYLPIPDSYFCVVVDPHSYPYDTPSRVHIDCFIIPQDAPSGSSPEDYPATLEEVEEATNLKFFDSWGREIPVGLAMRAGPPSESRLMQVLKKKKAVAADEGIEKARSEAKTIDELIDILKSEAARIQIQGRALTEDETKRLETIQHTISWLLQVRDLLKSPKEPVQESNFVTYKIIDDLGGRLKQGARTACNFWNRFLQPKYSIVIRLGTFTQSSNTIARAYEPYERDGVHYGQVEFNTKYLWQFSENQIAGTIVHEVGHSLGIGWDEWDKLFNRSTGKFKSKAIRRLRGLEQMEVELDGGPGTAYAHWDEAMFDKELMTGYQDHGEHVLPITIDLMKVLGHKVSERLENKTDLGELLENVANMVFSRQDEVRSIDLEHFEKTELFEYIPHTLPLDGDGKDGAASK